MPCVTSACLPRISAVAVAEGLVGAQPLGDRSKVTPPMCAVHASHPASKSSVKCGVLSTLGATAHPKENGRGVCTWTIREVGHFVPFSEVCIDSNPIATAVTLIIHRLTGVCSFSV